jgi:hypothetical protein
VDNAEPPNQTFASHSLFMKIAFQFILIYFSLLK